VKNDISRQWAFMPPTVGGAEYAARARQVESAGMAGIFVPQVYSAPFMGLGFCAAVTERVLLASGIAIAFTRSPFETAMTAMDLDRLSGGRHVLALGASVRSWVEGFYGEQHVGRSVPHMREVIEVVRRIVAESHTGTLDRYEGEYVRHDWTGFTGAAVPPVRERIPIWLAANQGALTRLAGEVADGFMSHPIHGVEWAAGPAGGKLAEGLARAGRRRSDVHWNAWLWMALNDDRDQAIEDCRGMMAFYGSLRQYQRVYESDGFGEVAQVCQELVDAGDMEAAMAAVPAEMIERYVVVGSADECRRAVARIWDVADSFCLVPPLTGLSEEQLRFYLDGIADTFYS
jgi:probable F420-dependent oxidoreductase